MDSTKQKIIQLWEYLDLQDEHLLIQVGNEELLLISKNDYGEIINTHIHLSNTDMTINEWVMKHNHPFVLIKQRNSEGKFEIPDTDKWKIDEELDY